MYFEFNSDDHLLRSYLEENGFIVIKNILDKSKINSLDNAFNNEFLKYAINHTGNSKVLPGASYLIEEIRNIIVDKKLNVIFKKLFNNKFYYFTSHCDMHLGLSSGWHKDDGGGSYFENLDNYFTDKDCKVFKVGFYLRDATNFGGLTVKKGSHKFNNKDQGENIYISSNLGDIFIFDVRLTHKGDETNSILQKIKKKIGFNPLNYDRKSVFFTYGADNEYTKIFSHKNIFRQKSQLKNYDISYKNKNFQNELNSLGVGLYE